MTKTKRILILPALLTLSFAGIASKDVWLSPKMQGEGLIQEEYKLNTLFKLPKLTKDGITYDCTIEFPSGATYFESEVLLSEVGVYTLHFTAEKDGKFYSETETFLVRSPYVGFSGTKSFANFENSERTYGHEGLYVSLAEGETLTFNDKIDLSKGSDIISLYAAPAMLGNMDFSELYITITEVANPKNVITARAKSSQEGVNNPYTYWAVKAGEQQLTGREEMNGKENIHINNDFGTPVLHSFYGLYPGYPSVKTGDAKLSLSYNKEKNAAYAAGTLLIADFDDPKYFTRLWDGFTSDLVTISISAKGYSGSSAGFVITSLLGKDLSKETIIDTKGPEITVDFPYTKAPAAKVGYRYPIFKASATDEEDGECSVKARVYYNYGSEKTNLVEIVDDSFEVAQKGVYGIVYEAKDRTGNVSKKVILVSTEEEIKPLAVKTPEGVITSVKQGEIYTFPEMVVEGGSGNTNTTYEVYLNNEKYPSEETNFIPKEIGTYEIVSKTTDIIGQVEEVRYNLEVVTNDGAVLYDNVVFPKYYVSGGIYTLPEAICYDYSSGKALAAPMEVTISNGVYTYEAVSGDSFVPQVTGSQEKLEFTYHYKNLTFKKNVTTINPYIRKGGIERFAIQNFLITENLNLEVGDTNMGVYAKTRGDASFDFANAIIAENASIQLATDPEKEDFKAVEVAFTDSLNESEKVTMRIQRNSSGNIDFKIDKRSYPSKSSFSKNNTLTFGYSDGYFSFEGMGIEASVYDNGEAFKGFSSGKIYISMALKDAKANAGIRLAKIDNQSMAYATDDYGVPRIIIHGDYGGTYRYGDLATVNRVESSDVLDPNSSVTVTVRNPDGKIVRDTDGILLEKVVASKEYQIKLEGYGQFIVTYEAMDTADNTSNFIYAINVEDDVAPTIEITGSLPKTVKVGDTVRVPAFKVSDDQDENVEATVYVTTSHGEVIFLGSHNAFKPKYEGTYTLRIRAMDKAGNVSYETLTFEVTK